VFISEHSVHTSELQGVTCHMGSPDIGERAPHNHSQKGWYSIYLSRRDGRL